MKGSDKAVMLGVVIAIVLVGFYVKVLSPKRETASSLSKEITELQANIDQQQQVASFGEQARQEFPTFYGRLVVMGKAVPDQADTSSLMVQLSAIANRTDVEFEGIELNSSSGDSGGAAPTSSPPSTSTSSSTSTTSTTSTTSSSSGSSSSTTTPTTTPAPATEAGAANLPIGATVGTGEFATLPYSLNFTGSYFEVTDFLKGVDSLVHLRGSAQVAADGRLLTIDGFSLSEPEGTGPNPQLKVSLSVTSYVSPATEGLTAGATPSGPAPSLTQPQTQPASQTVTP